MLDQIGGLEEELLKYNNNKNKMLVEIDRIDEKKVKTK
jgi:hypothetical protein